MRVGVQDQMWARFALRLRAALDPAELVAAGPTMSGLRRIKSPEEVDRLRAAAAAADAAMLAITARAARRPHRGRGEPSHPRAADRRPGTTTPASPSSPRVRTRPARITSPATAGSMPVMPSSSTSAGREHGYASDTSRTAFVGEPPPEFAALYAVLRAAQSAACEAVAARDHRPRRSTPSRATIIAEAGLWRGLPASDRARHRPGDPRGAVHRRLEPGAAGRRATPSASSRGSTSGTRGARASRTSSSAPTDGGERLNTTSTELYLVG